jgi:hypothetical protein
MKLFTRWRALLLSATMLFGTLGAVTVSATPASAGGCNAGTWGYVWGWGDCRGVGSQKWQLKVSCTWGGVGYSGIVTGDGHVDAKCNIGSARTASIIYQ